MKILLLIFGIVSIVAGAFICGRASVKWFALAILLHAPAFAQLMHDATIMQSTSPLRRGLVGYWRLEEASGTRYDCSKNGNHLTSNNSVGQGTGKQQFCSSFVGASSQYLSKSSPAAMPSGASATLTFCAWVNMTNKAGAGNTRDIGGVYDFGNNNRSFGLQYDGTTDRFRFIISSNGTTATVITGNTFGSPSQQTWYFLCGRYDGTNGLLSVNGGTEDSTSNVNGLKNAGTTAFTLGTWLNSGSPDSTANCMNGFIDEVGLWNRALPLTGVGSVAALYNATRGTHFPWAHP